MRSLMLVALVGLAACAQPEPEPAPPPGHMEAEGAVVASVDDAKITEGMVDAITRRMPPEQVQHMKDSGQWQGFLENLVIGQLLYDKAIERKLHEDPEVRQTLAMSSRQVLAQELLEKVAEESITDEAIEKAYEDRRVQFARPQVQARHILVKDKTLAEDLVQQLKDGADFEKLAAEHSVDPRSKESGGDLGWFEKGRMIRPVSDAAFASTGDEILGPVESRAGFHVVQVTDRRDSVPLEEVKPQLEQQVKKQAVDDYISGLKESANIVYGEGDAAPADDAAKGGEAAPTEGGDAAGDAHEGHGH